MKWMRRRLEAVERSLGLTITHVQRHNRNAAWAAWADGWLRGADRTEEAAASVGRRADTEVEAAACVLANAAAAHARAIEAVDGIWGATHSELVMDAADRQIVTAQRRARMAVDWAGRLEPGKDPGTTERQTNEVPNRPQ